MADKKSAAGWLVQVKVPGAAVGADEAVGAAKTPPSFQFFNVAIKVEIAKSGRPGVAPIGSGFG